jgi:pyruvate,water dikinase
MGMVDPMHWGGEDPSVMWAATNVAEAIPGVSTPLNWSFLGDPLERGALAAFHDLGAIGGSELELSDRAEGRFLVCFFGRTSVNVDRMRSLADGLPGSDGAAVEKQLFNSTRPEIPVRSRPWRTPIVVAKAARIATTIKGATLRTSDDTHSWWSGVRDRSEDLGQESEALFGEAQQRFERIFARHTVVSVLASGLYGETTRRLDELRPGLSEALFGGTSALTETTMLCALWNISRGHGDLDAFVDRYGYYGPKAGQIGSPVWRTDRTGLLGVLDSYSGMAEHRGPPSLQRRAVAARLAAEKLLPTLVSRHLRYPLLAQLRIGRALLSLRELGKASYLQCIDVGRMSAQARGRQLEASGVVDRAHDVFFLTGPEAWGRDTGDLRSVVAQRRTLHQTYSTYRLPMSWTGPAVPTVAPTTPEAGAPAAAGDRTPTVLTGAGVGSSPVTARARIVSDPDTSELRDGEILVCSTTDPSWTAQFLIAAGVVAEYGSALSHAAIVARELGIPCVIGAAEATRVIRTGDLVTVDPGRGEVRVTPGEHHEQEHRP